VAGSPGAINLNVVSKFDDKGIKKATAEISGIGSGLKKLGGIIAAAFSVKAITDFAKESILAAEGVATANARIGQIANQMDLFGKQTDAVTQRLIKFAEANELTVAVDAEVIKATQAKLLTFKEIAKTADTVGGSFDRATLAAVDLAAAGFGSAETNAIQLGKALNDPIKGITALTRSGITFTEQEKAKIKTLTESGKVLEAQDMILKAIEKQVGGTAAATANASDKMKLAFDNVKETVGAALLPAFDSLVVRLLPVVEKLGPQLASIFSALIPVFDKVAILLPRLIDSFLPLIDVLADIMVLVGDLAIDMMPAFMAIMDALLPVVMAILPPLAAFLKDLMEPLAPAIIALMKALQPVIDKILPVFLDLINQLLPVFLMLLDEALVPLIPIFASLIVAMLPLLDELLPLLTMLLKDVVVPALRLTASVISQVLISAVKFLAGTFDNVLPGIRKFAEVFRTVFTGIVDFMKPIVNSIIGLIESMVNGIITGINAMTRALNRISFTLPSWIPLIGGQTFALRLPEISTLKIPRLADGGVVLPRPGGVLANIAEAGQAEAVIPLDRFGDLGGKSTYNITVNAGMGADGSDIGRKIVEEILRYERSSGRVFARA